MKHIMATNHKNAVPFEPVHPGGILKEELRSRGIRQKDFAGKIGLQPTHLSALLNGKRNISATIAAKLEQELGIPATFWMSLQNSYELDKKEITQKESQPETFTVTIPAQDHNLFRDLIRRMGWACVF